MIIGIVNQKGGVGKTTLTVNVAGEIMRRGHSACIVDCDPQGSVLQWNALDEASALMVRHMPAGVTKSKIRKLSRTADHILIDSPPALEKTTVDVLKLIQHAIVPVTPSPLDIWSASETIGLIRTIQKRYRNLRMGLLVYRKIPGTRIGRQASAALKQYALPVFKTEITQRIAYVEAMNTGRSVVDHAPHSKAASEIHAFVEELIYGSK